MNDPKTLGRYQIETFLGKGAFADVYKAMDTMLKRTVALKVLKPALMADEEAFARFTREAQVLANLVHPRIAWVWDMGEADGRYFIAMRYVQGKSLEKILAERGALGWNEALKITEQVVEALEFAHGKGLVHRDVKPQNILLSEKEGAILTDFGLVKAMQSSGITGSGSHLGTPQYMAPELWDGKEASPASDQYALACLIAEMLIGTMLFEGSTPVVIRKHLMEEPLLPSGLPEHVVKGLQCALAKLPAERFETIRNFVDVLHVTPQEPKHEPRSAEKRVTKNVSRTRVAQKKVRPDKVQTKGDELIITLAEGVEMTFVRVPAGEFMMGSDTFGDEEPEHKVHLNEYWIGKTPVTNTQYRAFGNSTGREVPWENGKIPKGKEGHPVTYVSWEDARAFCQWASQQTGETIRLPSEAEWEKAARGTDGRIYPWGNQKPGRGLCNYDASGTSQVGRQSPAGDSPYGCQDMAGNVWEWVNDWYGETYYQSSPSLNPTGPSSGEYRVLRGGSWYGFDSVVRTSYRSLNEPTNSNNYLGFRCSRGTSP